jgi:hypothetical protein
MCVWYEQRGISLCELPTLSYFVLVNSLTFVSGPPKSKKQKTWSFPHLDISPSAYARWSPSCDPVNEAPLYTHWLAMQMYKEFDHLSTSHTMENGFEFTPNASSLERVVKNFMLLEQFSSSSVREGRGVMCNSELKCAEIAHTGFFALELHKFLFGNETATTGACYHQYPVAKVSQSILTADFYVCGLHEDKLPGNPIVLGDMKSENLVSASKETAAYCVKAIEGKRTITVILGLAMTRNRAKLFVNLAGNCKMFQTEVCEVRSVDIPCTKAFFTVLYGAVHSLIKQPVEYENPCFYFVPFADRDVEQIGRRVFLDKDKQTVYKLYDNELSEDPSASNQALKQLGGDYLHNVSITQLNKRVHCLQYDYISATMPQLCQFAFIMKDLNRLHLKGYVHGDIRKENLLFSDNYAWMIDFDLTQLEDTLYPSNYNSSIEERHRDARVSRPMKKSHDLYALSIIIEHFFVHSGQTTYSFEDLSQILTP